VRLTVGGKTYRQPITLKLDPRVVASASAADLATLASLTREMYEGARAARATYTQARALVAHLDALSGDDLASFKAAVDALAPAGGGAGGPPSPRASAGQAGRGGGFGGGPGGPPAPGASAGQAGRGAAAVAPTLQSVSTEMMSAAMAMQAADAAPTAREVAACTTARTNAASVLARWTRLTTVELAAINTKRKAAGQPVIVMPKS
jgi:hypothetical protein